jgi:hypothetical protein
VIGGAVDDRHIRADGVQIEDRAGTSQENKRPTVGSTAAQVRGHRLLGGLVQTLLDHIDDQGAGVLVFEADKQSDEGIR